MPFITFGICFPHRSSVELHILYFVFCLLNPHPVAPASHPVNIPIGFIPTALGDHGLCSLLDGTFWWLMGFSFLLALFLYKSRDPWDPSTGDGSVGNAEGVFSPSPFFLLPYFFSPQPLTRNVLLSFCYFSFFLTFCPVSSHFLLLSETPPANCTSPKSLLFQR